MCSTFWLYIDFDGAKNIHVLYVPIWDFGGQWSLDVPDCSLVSLSWFVYGHWYLIHMCSTFWLYIDFDGAKNIHVLYVPIWDFGGRWSLDVPDCSLVSLSWFVYGHWSLIHPGPKFWSPLLILKLLRTSMFWRRLEVPDWSFFLRFWGYVPPKVLL